MVEAEIIIIGGGAAGLMAAVSAAETLNQQDKTGRIIVLEKMQRPGRKIMITGKGRCNFTNLKAWNEFSLNIHPKPNFLKPSFYNLTPEKTIDFFQKNGMETIVERGDRAFPASYRASEIVDTLIKAVEKARGEIICNQEVTKISHKVDSTMPQKTKFIINCIDGSKYICSKLIISTGGLSYPATGSTGDGYKWAEKTGHTIKPCFPSLTALVPKDYKIDIKKGDMKGHIPRETPLSNSGKCLCGNKLKNVGLYLLIDGNQVAYEFGDLDFTDGGIEGPIGFKMSRRCVNAILNGSKVSFILDLKPAVEFEVLADRITRLWQEITKDKRFFSKKYPEKYKILLTRLLPSHLIPAFLLHNPNIDHKSLAKALKNWEFDISGFVGYERSVVTAGGVSQDDIVAKTLESKIMPGLYFAGEILDLDAETGGYNLQIAFSTGYLAGISAAKSI